MKKPPPKKSTKKSGKGVKPPAKKAAKKTASKKGTTKAASTNPPHPFNLVVMNGGKKKAQQPQPTGAPPNDPMAAYYDPDYLNAALVMGQHKRLPELPTPNLVQSILACIRNGSHPQVACAANGIPQTLYASWRQRSVEEPDGPFAAFFYACEVAEAVDEVTDVHMISIGARHAPGLQWKRERRSPERWAPKHSVRVGGSLMDDPDRATPRALIDPTTSVDDGAQLIELLAGVGYAIIDSAPSGT